jgi:hypothetical protein
MDPVNERAFLALTTPLVQESIRDGGETAKLRGAAGSDSDSLPLIRDHLFSMLLASVNRRWRLCG